MFYLLRQSPWGMAMCLVLVFSIVGTIGEGLKLVLFLLGNEQLILKVVGFLKINILAVKHLKIYLKINK